MLHYVRMYWRRLMNGLENAPSLAQSRALSADVCRNVCLESLSGPKVGFRTKIDFQASGSLEGQSRLAME